jgi:hypothetical protein
MTSRPAPTRGLTRRENKTMEATKGRRSKTFVRMTQTLVRGTYVRLYSSCYRDKCARNQPLEPKTPGGFFFWRSQWPSVSGVVCATTAVLRRESSRRITGGFGSLRTTAWAR